MRAFLRNSRLSAFLSAGLIVVLGGFGALYCLILLLVEFVLQLISIPIIFLVTIGVLAFGLTKRNLSLHLHSKSTAA
jgi:hypothetical protein